LQYSLPDTALILRTLQTRFSSLAVDRMSWDNVAAEAEGLSYADIIRACEDAAKEAVLTGSHLVTTSMLIRSISERKGMPRRA